MPKKKEKKKEIEPTGDPSIVAEEAREAAMKASAKARERLAKPVTLDAEKVEAAPVVFAQGEYHVKVVALLAEAREVYGREPTPEEMLMLKKAVRAEEPLPAPLPKEEIA